MREKTVNVFSRRLVVYLVFAVVISYQLLPFVWLMLASFNPNASPATEIPKQPSLVNFVKVLTTKETPMWIANSFLICTGVTVLTIVLSTFVAYPLSRISFRAKDAFMYVILFSAMMPVSTTMIPIYSLCLLLQLTDTYIGVILVLTGIQLPMFVWIMKGAIDTIPQQLEEAAWVEGCTRFGSMLRIVFPLLGPALAVVALLSFLGAWSDFLVPFILLRSSSKLPIAVGLFTGLFYTTRGFVFYGPLSAMSLLYTLPIVVLYLFLSKYLVKGMVVGALKG